MDYLFYCRDRPGTEGLLEQFVEAHWAFMDGYADRLLVRGPTLSDNGEQHTGSLHLVRLDSLAETEVFAFQEPFYRAGIYADVNIWRWQDQLGRPMHHSNSNEDSPLFLLLGATEQDLTLKDVPVQHRNRFGAFGRTGPLEATAWTGFAAVLQSPSRAAVGSFLPASLGRHVEVHRWCIGGRR